METENNQVNETIDVNNVDINALAAIDAQSINSKNINFTALGTLGYHYICEYNQGIYCIQFQLRNCELRIYVQDSAGTKYFVRNVNTESNENTVCFKLDVPDGVTVELMTSHVVTKASVMYE